MIRTLIRAHDLSPSFTIDLPKSQANGSKVALVVCEDIDVLDSSFLDLPNVTALKNGEGSKIQIFSSAKWGKLNGLSDLFVSIISHESIHIILTEFDGGASEAFDEIGSVSAISKSWRGLAKCTSYHHGIVGLDKLVK